MRIDDRDFKFVAYGLSLIVVFIFLLGIREVVHEDARRHAAVGRSGPDTP
jgi:hypothetical protein